MATTLKVTTATPGGGTTVSFSNTPQAGDDLLTPSSLSEDSLGIATLNVMANDQGGAAKSLWSLDDGTSAVPLGTNPNGTTYNKDLLTHDTAYENDLAAEGANGTTDKSLNGARIWITSDGMVKYDASTLNQTFLNHLNTLGAGEYATDSFTYAIRLANGTLSWATTSVQIAGVNDAAVVDGTTTGSIKEDASAILPATEGITETTGSTLTFTDADLTDTHTASAGAGTLGTATAGVSHDTVGTGTGGVVDWTYSVNDSAIDYLAEGQTTTDSFTVHLTEHHPDSTTSVVDKTVNITITGTEDPVSITGADAAGGVREDAPTVADPSSSQSATGSIAFTDPDLSDSHTALVTASPVAALGTFSLDGVSEAANAAGGTVQWHYVLDNTAAQHLSEGQTVVEHYTVTIDDLHGSTTTQDVAITITGTNDQPTLTITDDAGSMNEGNGTATISDSGALSSNDVDTNDIVTVSTSYNGDIAWSGGSLDGTLATALVNGFSVDQNSWDYSSNQNLDFLSKDETITFSYNVVATDNSNTATSTSAPHQVTITIHGTNDAPTVDSVDAGTINDTPASGETFGALTGQLVGHDLDHVDTMTYAIDPLDPNNSPYGTLSVTADGQYTFTPNSAAIDALGASDHKTVTYSVQVTDSNGGVGTNTLTVHINGADEAAVVPHTGSQNIDLQFAAPQLGLSHHSDPTFTIALPSGFDFTGTADLTITGDIDAASEHVFLTFEGGSQVNVSNVGGGGPGEPDSVSASALGVIFSSTDSSLTLSYHTSDDVGGNVHIVGTLNYAYDTLV